MPRPQNATRGRPGFTLVEILVVVAIVATLAVIGVPSALRGRMTANESTAVSNLTVIVSGLEMYRNVYASFPDTGTWQASMFDNADPDFLSRQFSGDMNGQEIQGYLYTYTRLGAAGDQQYEFTVTPVTPGLTGERAFFANYFAIVHHCRCSAGASCPGATAMSNPLQQQPNTC